MLRHLIQVFTVIYVPYKDVRPLWVITCTMNSIVHSQCCVVLEWPSLTLHELKFTRVYSSHFKVPNYFGIDNSRKSPIFVMMQYADNCFPSIV